MEDGALYLCCIPYSWAGSLKLPNPELGPLLNSFYPVKVGTLATVVGTVGGRFGLLSWFPGFYLIGSRLNLN